jgi:hypothetical protein
MDTTKSTRVLYARQCQITGNLFNQGYCIDDGRMYIMSGKHLIEHIKNETKYATLEDAFEDEYYCYTEWDEDDIWNVDLLKAYYVMKEQGFHVTIDLEDDAIYLSAWNEDLQDTVDCKVTAEEVTSRASQFES